MPSTSRCTSVPLHELVELKSQMTRRLRHAITAEPLPIHALSWPTRITWACPLVRGLRPALTAPRGTSASALASHPSPLGCPVLVHPLAQALSCCGGVSSSRRRHSRCKAVAEWCGLAPRHGHNHDMHLSRTENDPVHDHEGAVRFAIPLPSSRPLGTPV